MSIQQPRTPNTAAPPRPTLTPAEGRSPGRDLLLCVWFLVAALGFFGPYLGLVPVAMGPQPPGGALPTNPLTPAYALFLLLSVLALALRLLKGRAGAPRD